MNAAVIVGVLEIGLGVGTLVLMRRNWFSGAPLLILRISYGFAAASLLSFSATYFINTPQVHGVLLVVALGALIAFGVAKLRRRTQRPAAVHAETENARNWTIIRDPAAARTRAPLRPGYSGTSPTVRGIEAMEVAS